MKKYRIMKTDDGKYFAQVRRFIFWWDDIFYAGMMGLTTHSMWKLSHWSKHNNRYFDSIEDAEICINEYKNEDKEPNLTKVK